MNIAGGGPCAVRSKFELFGEPGLEGSVYGGRGQGPLQCGGVSFMVRSSASWVMVTWDVPCEETDRQTHTTENIITSRNFLCGRQKFQNIR